MAEEYKNKTIIERNLEIGIIGLDGFFGGRELWWDSVAGEMINEYCEKQDTPDSKISDRSPEASRLFSGLWKEGDQTDYLFIRRGRVGNLLFSYEVKADSSIKSTGDIDYVLETGSFEEIINITLNIKKQKITDAYNSKEWNPIPAPTLISIGCNNNQSYLRDYNEKFWEDVKNPDSLPLEKEVVELEQRIEELKNVIERGPHSAVLLSNIIVSFMDNCKYAY